jgi:hypothetical protein
VVFDKSPIRRRPFSRSAASTRQICKDAPSGADLSPKAEGDARAGPVQQVGQNRTRAVPCYVRSAYCPADPDRAAQRSIHAFPSGGRMP